MNASLVTLAPTRRSLCILAGATPRTDLACYASSARLSHMNLCDSCRRLTRTVRVAHRVPLVSWAASPLPLAPALASTACRASRRDRLCRPPRPLRAVLLLLRGQNNAAVLSWATPRAVCRLGCRRHRLFTRVAAPFDRLTSAVRRAGVTGFVIDVRPHTANLCLPVPSPACYLAVTL